MLVVFAVVGGGGGGGRGRGTAVSATGNQLQTMQSNGQTSLLGQLEDQTTRGVGVMTSQELPGGTAVTDQGWRTAKYFHLQLRVSPKIKSDTKHWVK